MDLTLQATQPLLLCNLYISSRIPKAAHIHSSRHLKLKARASLTMPAVLDDMEPQQWVPPLSVEDCRYSTQTDQHFLGKRNIQFLSLSAGAEQIWNVDVNPLTGWRSNNKIMRLSTNLYRWAWKFGLTAATSDDSSCFWLEHHCMMLISFSLALCVSNVNKCWPVCIFMLTSSTVSHLHISSKGSTISTLHMKLQQQLSASVPKRNGTHYPKQPRTRRRGKVTLLGIGIRPKCTSPNVLKMS